MKRKYNRIALLLAAALLPFCAGSSLEGLGYKSGFSTLELLGRDIRRTLDDKESVECDPISFDSSPRPFLALMNRREGTREIHGVWVSEGFITLVNRVSHAKAIDRHEHGYFTAYLRALERDGDSIPELPGVSNPDFWSDEVVNEQLSNFNSIAGVAIGMELAHQYLGHYKKYGAQLGPAATVPINNLLTQDEWEEAYHHAARNAMNAACMMEGVIPFLQGIDKMKRRPAWAAWFMPDRIHFDSVRRQMLKLQHGFLKD